MHKAQVLLPIRVEGQHLRVCQEWQKRIRSPRRHLQALGIFSHYSNVKGQETNLEGNAQISAICVSHFLPDLAFFATA